MNSADQLCEAPVNYESDFCITNSKNAVLVVATESFVAVSGALVAVDRACA